MFRTIKRHQYLCWSLLTLIALTFPVCAQAQFGDLLLDEKVPREKLSVKNYLSLDKVQPGSQFQMAVVVEIAKGWHVNANPAKEGFIATQITLPEAPHLTFGEVVYPAGDVLKLASIGEAPVYHDTITIGIQADLSQTAPVGLSTLGFQLQYQACNDEQCLLPETLDFSIPIEVVGIEETVQRINETVLLILNSRHHRGLPATKEALSVPSPVDRCGWRSYSCLPVGS